MRTQQTEQLANVLHAKLCEYEDGDACRRWLSSMEIGVRHRAYYHERAEAIMGKLEPEIGSANVILVVESVLGEVL